MLAPPAGRAAALSTVCGLPAVCVLSAVCRLSLASGAATPVTTGASAVLACRSAVNAAPRPWCPIRAAVAATWPRQPGGVRASGAGLPGRPRATWPRGRIGAADRCLAGQVLKLVGQRRQVSCPVPPADGGADQEVRQRRVPRQAGPPQVGTDSCAPDDALGAVAVVAVPGEYLPQWLRGRAQVGTPAVVLEADQHLAAPAHHKLTNRTVCTRLGDRAVAGAGHRAEPDCPGIKDLDAAVLGALLGLAEPAEQLVPAADGQHRGAGPPLPPGSPRP